MNEETIESKLIYEGKILNLRVDTIKGPHGISQREIIDHAKAVTIIPFREPDTIFLIHQFRKPTEQVLIELPAGCMEPNEDPLIAAKRELQEETGFKSNQFTQVGEMYMAPGFCNEYMYFYVAEGLVEGDTNMDSDEYMELHQYTLPQIKTMINEHQIIDAKTILGAYFIDEFIRNRTNRI